MPFPLRERAAGVRDIAREIFDIVMGVVVERMQQESPQKPASLGGIRQARRMCGERHKGCVEVLTEDVPGESLGHRSNLILSLWRRPRAELLRAAVAGEVALPAYVHCYGRSHDIICTQVAEQAFLAGNTHWLHALQAERQQVQHRQHGNRQQRRLAQMNESDHEPDGDGDLQSSPYRPRYVVAEEIQFARNGEQHTGRGNGCGDQAISIA
jgi:hypothetical protein